jgi:hypothetical protein
VAAAVDTMEFLEVFFFGVAALSAPFFPFCLALLDPVLV